MRLRTVQDVSRELRRVYVAARCGDIDPADATKLAFVLGQIREALAIEAESVSEKSLTAQEKALAFAKGLCMHFQGRPLPPELAAPAEQPAAPMLESGPAETPSAESVPQSADPAAVLPAPAAATPRATPRPSGPAATRRAREIWPAKFLPDGSGRRY